MNRLIVVLLALVCILERSAGAADSPATSGKPNILWITAEDICPNLGCYGDSDAVTPNLDRFAARSVRFIRAVRQAGRRWPPAFIRRGSARSSIVARYG